jgi:DNA-binding transcriptional ArsR family regulator
MPDPFADLCAAAAVELGFSRPAGLIFSVVFSAAEPPTADDLCAALGLSRSNVSTALKELRQTGLVTVERIQGDRKEHFTAPRDGWAVVSRLVAARRARVIDPALDALSRLGAGAGIGHLSLAAALQDLAALAEAAGRMDPADLGKLAARGLTPETRKKDKKRRKKA